MENPSLEKFVTGKDAPDASFESPLTFLELKNILKSKINLQHPSLIPRFNALLKLPFSLRSFLDHSELSMLRQVLEAHYTSSSSQPDTQKLAAKNIALFATNIIRNLSTEDKIRTFIERGTLGDDVETETLSPHMPGEESKYALFGFDFTEIQYFSVINQVSKILPGVIRFLDDMVIEDEKDCTVVSRYKIKILTNTADHANADSVLGYLFKLLRVQNLKLGWTLSKAIYRLSKFCDKEDLVRGLRGLLTPEIIGQEMLWINVMSILGMLTFSRSSSAAYDRQRVRQALLYSRESEPLSGYVRETALFLIWTRIRANYGISSSIICTVILTAIFDGEFRTRKAATTVLQEYLGKYQHKSGEVFVDDREDTGEFFNTLPLSSSSLSQPKIADCLELINEVVVTNFRRVITSLPLLLKTPLIFLFKNHVSSLLHSNDFERRAVAAALTAKHFSVDENLITSSLSVAHNGYHLSLLFYNILNPDHPIFYKKSFLLKPYVSSRHFSSLSHTYLRLYKFSDRESLKANIIFLITKNFPEPEIISEIVFFLQSESEFTKKIFEMINMNGAALTANAGNHSYIQQIFELYRKNLEKRERVPETLASFRTCVSFLNDGRLSQAEGQAEERIDSLLDKNHHNVKQDLQRTITLQIYGLLSLAADQADDYSLGINGDAGYVVRRGAFLTLWQSRRILCYHFEIGKDPAELYKRLQGSLVRFLADRSKRLRDEVVEILVNELFSDYAGDQVVTRPYGTNEILEQVGCILRRSIGSSLNDTKCDETTKEKSDRACLGVCLACSSAALPDLLHTRLRVFFEKRRMCLESLGEEIAYKDTVLQPRDREEAHFYALFEAFGYDYAESDLRSIYFDMFAVGVVNTVVSSDSRIHNFLRSMIGARIELFYDRAFPYLIEKNPLSVLKFALFFDLGKERLKRLLDTLAPRNMSALERSLYNRLLVKTSGNPSLES